MKVVRWTRRIGSHKTGDTDVISDNDYERYFNRVVLIQNIGKRKGNPVRLKRKWLR